MNRFAPATTTAPDCDPAEAEAEKPAICRVDAGDRCASKLRIAFLSNGLFPYKIGGMQKHTSYLVRELARLGVKVDLFINDEGGLPGAATISGEVFDNDPRIAVKTVTHRQLPYFPGHYYFTWLWRSYRLYRALQHTGSTYDFVYAQGYAGWYSLAAKRLLGRSLPPIGVHGHGLEVLQEAPTPLNLAKNTLAPVWLRWNLRAADVALSLGGELNRLIASVGVPAQRIVPSYNGIVTDWLRPAEEISATRETARFLFVGRDAERKGFRELNEAIEALQSRPGFAIDIVGKIGARRRVASDRVTYHGEVREESRLREIYRQCDVLVCPSYAEGMPTVVLEAMASGLAVIATDIAAVPLAVSDENGWLIEPRNATALLSAMQEAMHCDLAPKKLAARKKAEEFTWPRVAARLLEELSRHIETDQRAAAVRS